MSFRELVLVEWICDVCDLSVIGDEALPDGWRMLAGVEEVACAVCNLRAGIAS